MRSEHELRKAFYEAAEQLSFHGIVVTPHQQYRQWQFFRQHARTNCHGGKCRQIRLQTLLLTYYPTAMKMARPMSRATRCEDPNRAIAVVLALLRAVPPRRRGGRA